MDFTVDVATIEDADAISTLVNSAYRGESSRLGWTTEADFLDGQRTDPDSIHALLRDPRQTILLLRDHSKAAILGCVNLERTSNQSCYLGMLTILPTLQAKGAGRQLLTAGEKFARQNWQACQVTLGVIHVRESLIAWYERRGYKKSGKTKPFPYGNERYGLPKRNDLYFVFLDKNIIE